MRVAVQLDGVPELRTADVEGEYVVSEDPASRASKAGSTPKSQPELRLSTSLIPAFAPTVPPDSQEKEKQSHLSSTNGAKAKKGFGRDLVDCAIRIQRTYRSHFIRATTKSLSMKINVKYELQLSRTRMKRRGLFTKLLKSLLYIALFIGVVFLQYGSTVADRFALEKTMDDFVAGLESPSGLKIASVNTVERFLDWVDTAFLTQIVSEDRVWVRTHNQVIGSVRLENIRVTDTSCGWKTPDAVARFGVKGDLNECHGPLTGGNLERLPYGPKFDPEVFKATEIDGQPRYIVDLGRNPRFAKQRLLALRDLKYVSKSTRKLQLTMLVYNGALPMFCYVRVVALAHPTGKLKVSVSSQSINVQDYLFETSFLQFFFEISLVVLTLGRLYFETMEMRKRGIRNYCSDVYNVSDLLQIAGVTLGAIFWIRLTSDTSRAIDLEAREFIDLEAYQTTFVQYNIIVCLTLLVSVVSTLQYVKISPRLSILANSLAQMMSELPYFLILTAILFFTYAIVGHLLFGASLEEWSSMTRAINTCWAAFRTGFKLHTIEAAFPLPSDSLTLFAGTIYCYTFQFLMAMILSNVLMAILMMGYREARQATVDSPAQVAFNKNVGTVWTVAQEWYMDFELQALRYSRWLLGRSQTDAEKLRWQESRWEHTLSVVVRMGQKKHINLVSMTLITLAREMRSMGLADDMSGGLLLNMILKRYYHRAFKTPPNMLNPFKDNKPGQMLASIDKRLRDMAFKYDQQASSQSISFLQESDELLAVKAELRDLRAEIRALLNNGHGPVSGADRGRLPVQTSSPLEGFQTVSHRAVDYLGSLLSTRAEPRPRIYAGNTTTVLSTPTPNGMPNGTMNGELNVRV